MSYASTVLSMNPFAYYRLDEAPGATQLNDASGNGRNMPLFNLGGWSYQQPSLLLNGETDYSVQMGGTEYGSINTNYGLGSKTVVLLYKPLAAYSALVQWYGNGVAAGNTSGYNIGGYFGLCTTNPFTGLQSNAYHFTVGTRYFIAMTFSGYQTFFYIWNETGAHASGNANPGAIGQTGSFSLNTIGYTLMSNSSHTTQVVYGSGVIDEVAIFAGVMSTANINALAAAAGYQQSGAITLSASGTIRAHGTPVTKTAAARIGARGTKALNASASLIGAGKVIKAAFARIAGGVPFSMNAFARLMAPGVKTLTAKASVALGGLRTLDAQARLQLPAAAPVNLDAAARINAPGVVSLTATASINASLTVVPLGASARLLGNGLVVLGATARISRTSTTEWVDRKYSLVPAVRVTSLRKVRRGPRDTYGQTNARFT